MIRDATTVIFAAKSTVAVEDELKQYSGLLRDEQTFISVVNSEDFSKVSGLPASTPWVIVGEVYDTTRVFLTSNFGQPTTADKAINLKNDNVVPPVYRANAPRW